MVALKEKESTDIVTKNLQEIQVTLVVVQMCGHMLIQIMSYFVWRVLIAPQVLRQSLAVVESTSYYGGYGENSGMYFSQRTWECPLMMNAEEYIAVGIPSQQDMVSIVHPIAEEIRCGGRKSICFTGVELT